MFSTRLLIFALFCISSVLSKKKICDLNDHECLKESANRAFKQFVAGLDGLEPSDPLNLDLIEANLPTLKYKLINASLFGMQSCHVDLAQILVQEQKYMYNVRCPHLILESDYDVKGKLGLEFIEGTGTCKLDMYDYHFIFNGEFEKFISAKGKLHIQLKNHELGYEAKAKVNYDCKNLFNGDKAKSDVLHKYANENWQIVHKLTRQPTMEAFMDKYINNLNAYMKIRSYEDLFYKE